MTALLRRLWAWLREPDLRHTPVPAPPRPRQDPHRTVIRVEIDADQARAVLAEMQAEVTRLEAALTTLLARLDEARREAPAYPGIPDSSRAASTQAAGHLPRPAARPGAVEGGASTETDADAGGEG